MESKIIKALVVLGVPGVALGVFYLVLRQFNFQFETIAPTETAVIAVIFLLMVGGITFYAIHRWAPERRIQESEGGAQSTAHDRPDVRVKATWGIPTGMGRNVNSVLFIDIQNHSDQIFFFNSLYLELSKGKTMVPRVDAFDRPVPGPTKIDPGSSLNVALDFLEITGAALEAGDLTIQRVVIRDQIDRVFYSSTEDMQIAIHNMKMWQKKA